MGRGTRAPPNFLGENLMRLDEMMKFNAHEEFLGLYEVTSTEAVTTFKSIKGIFRQLNLSFTKERRQCFDIGPSMAGSRNAVAVKIRSLEPRAFSDPMLMGLGMRA